jgi:hypothetical protein
MHCRKQIRDAVIAQLKTDLPSHEVYNFKMVAFEQAQLPAISVYTDEEDSSKSNIQGVIVRTLTLRVELYRKGKNVVDEIDEDLETVEPSVLDGLSMLTLEDEPLLERTDCTVSDESNKRLGAVRLEYTVRYRTDPYNPSSFVE